MNIKSVLWIENALPNLTIQKHTRIRNCSKELIYIIEGNTERISAFATLSPPEHIYYVIHPARTIAEIAKQRNGIKATPYIKTSSLTLVIETRPSKAALILLQKISPILVSRVAAKEELHKYLSDSRVEYKYCDANSSIGKV